MSNMKVQIMRTLEQDSRNLQQDIGRETEVNFRNIYNMDSYVGSSYQNLQLIMGMSTAISWIATINCTTTRCPNTRFNQASSTTDTVVSTQ